MRFFIALLTIISLIGAGCGGPSAAQQAATEQVSLKIWRVFDDDSTFQDLMSAYQGIHPNVSFEYRQLRVEEYEDELLRAFAEGKGPDIFSIHNTWIGEYESLIQPLPKSLKIAYSETRGTIKKETVYTLKEEPSLSLRSLRSDFVDVVAQDVLRSYKPNDRAQAEERIYGLPLSVDTLSLYFNKNLLNAAGIPEPPATWTQFQEQVSKLTRIGPNDKILQSGAAIGSGKNVERASDILSLLLLQNGSPIVDARGVAQFSGRDTSIVASDAVRFYTDFANPLKQVYSWNADQPNSFEAFANGKAAFFFGYSYHASLLRARSPKLNFAITSVPQIEGAKTVNYANYWLETVAKAANEQDWAWDFIQFATNKNHVTSYLTTARKPTALRALINTQIEDELLSAFVKQTLTAKSWYTGRDAQAAEQALIDLIDAVLDGALVEDELVTAENKINQTL